jgi:hypothetical protein
MNNTRGRKYARTLKKTYTQPSSESEDTEFSMSVAAALGLLGGTFLVGVLSGKLLDMCIKRY